jgi:hypothetical protein
MGRFDEKHFFYFLSLFCKGLYILFVVLVLLLYIMVQVGHKADWGFRSTVKIKAYMSRVLSDENFSVDRPKISTPCEWDDN